MKIVLLTLGTRGDVQPYAVLGKAFRDRGHEVILSTGKNFHSLAQEYGIQFVPVKADFQQLVNSPEGKAMMKNPFTARKHFKTVVQPMMVDALKGFYEISKSCDYVLYHVKSLADYFADQFPEKMIRANVVPAVHRTSRFPNPVFSGLALPAFLNRFTYKLSDLGLAMMNNAVRQFRESNNLKPLLPKRLKLPAIYGISEAVLPMPDDYPDNIRFTGFWYGSGGQALDPEVVTFLSNGRKNVLVTFGSMAFETKFDLAKSLAAISERLDVNVIVVKGWGFENINFAESPSIKMIDAAPFDKLIPLVDAVVFHGGIGTMAECFRAGVPFMTCPVIYPMGDQHFWGKRAYELGCAPMPIPLKRLDEQVLEQKISGLLSSESMKNNCKKIARSLALENGSSNAATFVENLQT